MQPGLKRTTDSVILQEMIKDMPETGNYRNKSQKSAAYKQEKQQSLLGVASRGIENKFGKVDWLKPGYTRPPLSVERV
jgi:hypothetical protein